MDEEKWNLENVDCPRGFNRFGTIDGCYRIAGEYCDWSGLYPAAVTECEKYGPTVHLAGNENFGIISSLLFNNIIQVM